MYKIYINETPLLLMNTNDLGPDFMSENNQLVSRYTNKAKFLLTHVDMLEKSKRFNRVIMHTNDLSKLWSDFKALFKVIKAAGGLVYTPNHEVLAIYRMGFWDLPKGKIEKGEGKKKAAIREVIEETGISSLDLEHRLLKTYHTYQDTRFTNKRILKVTYWYKMTGSKEDLVPQLEEDIEKAVWMAPKELLTKRPIYQNIIDVIKASEG